MGREGDLRRRMVMGGECIVLLVSVVGEDINTEADNLPVNI